MCKGYYSPKIKEDYIPVLYLIAKEQKIPMTKLVNRMIENEVNLSLKGSTLRRKDITTEELQTLLSGTKIKLDCGHYSTIGHSFANTIIIVSTGGGKIETYCHNCGY